MRPHLRARQSTPARSLSRFAVAARIACSRLAFPKSPTEHVTRIGIISAPHKVQGRPGDEGSRPVPHTIPVAGPPCRARRSGRRFAALPRGCRGVDITIQVPLGAERVGVLGSAERNLKMIREALGVNIT